MPIRLIVAAVTDGARMTSQRRLPRSASKPKSGLISDGSWRKEASVPANVNDRPRFWMMSGKSGERKLVKMSWMRWPLEMMMT